MIVASSLWTRQMISVRVGASDAEVEEPAVVSEGDLAVVVDGVVADAPDVGVGVPFGEPPVMELVQQRLGDAVSRGHLAVGELLDRHGFDEDLVLGHRSRCPETSPLHQTHCSRCPETPVHDVLKPDTSGGTVRSSRAIVELWLEIRLVSQRCRRHTARRTSRDSWSTSRRIPAPTAVKATRSCSSSITCRASRRSST